LSLLPRCTAAFLLCAFAATGAAAQQESLQPIALVPVVVHSAEDPDYLRAGLEDMMVSRLEQAGLFRVIRISDPSKATTNLEQALDTAREVGAAFVLFGSFTRFGQGASLDMQAASTAPGSGEPLREIFVHAGSIGDVIPDLDELVGKVSRFAVSDYDGSAVSSGPASERARPSVDKLRRRVDALERETRDLRREVEDANTALQQQRPSGSGS
jgi:TolB-like protein